MPGCGFTPTYAPGASALGLRDQIKIDPPSTRTEFTFVSRFEDRLGRGGGAPYALSFDLNTSTDGLAITPDQETLRYNLSGDVAYQIRDSASGTVLTSGVVESFTAYSAIGTTVATRASQLDANDRLAVILADQLVTRLEASAGSWLP